MSSADVVLGAFAPGVVRVDPAGRLAASDAGWTVGWRVRADDRWRDPAQEAAVRRRGVGGGVGVEVAMRVPGGDARSLTWVVPHGSGSVAVLEVHNDSPVPFVLALDVGCLAGAGRGGVRLEGSEPRVSDRPVVWSARAPRQVDGHDGADRVTLSWPVPHRTSVRLLIPLHPASAAGPPARVPNLDDAVSGWDALVAAGVRLDVPEPGLGEAAAAATRRALVAAAQEPSSVHGDARLAAGLTGWGLTDVAARTLARAIEGVGPDGGVPDEGLAAVAAVLVALARWWQVTGDAAMARSATDAVAAMGEWLVATANGRTGWRRRPTLASAEDGARAVAGLDAAADLLAAAGDGDASDAARHAAASLRQLVAERFVDGVAGEHRSVSGAELVRARWIEGLLVDPHDGDGGVAAAEVLEAVVASFVREQPTGIELLPDLPGHWRGGPLEVHGVPTRHGRIAFAVRWHGDRPALLWEREPLPAADDADPVVLTAPGLDPSWADTRLRADALLARAVDVRAEPAPLRRDDAPVTTEPAPGPREGESFG